LAPSNTALTKAPTKAPTNIPTKAPTNAPPGVTNAPVTKAPVTVVGLPDNVNRDKAFDIQLIFNGASDELKSAFNAAVARWQQIIVTDTGNTVTFAAGTSVCNEEPFAANTLVDDLLIFVTFKPL
jgi:hypothetical protein